MAGKMDLTVLAVGSLKESYWKDAVREYEKRLSRYAGLTVLEVRDEPAPENAGGKTEAKILETEGKRLLSKIPKDAYVIALAIDGQERDSVGLAGKLREFAVSGKSRIAFLIGGSLGLSPEVLARADEKWSFSRLTFPHQMMRVILLEQIYRGFRILNNEPYHK